MRKSMMLGMSALALTVTMAPMQANAEGQSNSSRLQSCMESGNCIQAGNTGNVFVYGTNCDTDNVKDTLQNILNANGGNLSGVLNGNCGNIQDILNGICGSGTDCDTPEQDCDDVNCGDGNSNNGNGNNGNQNNGNQNNGTEQKPGDDSVTEDGTNLTYAQQVVNLVNVERAKEGLAPLKLDATVTRAANVRATEIQSSFSHTRPNGSSFSTVLGENGVSYRGSGENIAYGQRSPEEVVEGWMNSAGHRANIMNKNFQNIGVGHAINGNGTQYWVQLFTY